MSSMTPRNPAFFSAPKWFSNWTALRASFASQMAFLTFGIACAALVIAIVSAVQSGNSPQIGLVSSTTTALNITNCNKKILTPIPVGSSPTIRLPACRNNATIEFVPAVPSDLGNTVLLLDASGNQVTDLKTGVAGTVEYDSTQRVICSFTAGTIGCLVTP